MESQRHAIRVIGTVIVRAPRCVDHTEDAGGIDKRGAQPNTTSGAVLCKDVTTPSVLDTLLRARVRSYTQNFILRPRPQPI
mgnify:CR=1 FL=1